MQTVAYSYVRFSSGAQKDGFSIERQSEKAADLAARHNWRLDKTLRIDDHARSGFKGDKQRGLRAFLGAIQAGRVRAGEILIVERLDRLSRKELDTAKQVFESILRAGVLIATCAPERIYDRQSLNKSIQLIEMMLSFELAHEESVKKSDRATDNWQRIRDEARQGKRLLNTLCPAWLDKVGDGKNARLKLNPAKSAIVRRIYRLAIDGVGVRTICKTLNNEGIPSFTAGRRKNSVDIWQHQYVKNLLKSPSVFGRYQPQRLDDSGKRYDDGAPINNYYPAVIDEATYYKAQDICKSHRHTGKPARKVINLFKSILFDARTRDKMELIKTSQTERKAGSYRRISSRRYGISLSWKYEEFEASFLAFVRELSADRLLMNSKTIDQTEALQAKAADLEKRIADITASIGTAKNYTALIDVCKRLEDEHTATIEAIKQEQANQRGTIAENVKGLTSLIDTQ